MLKCLFDQVVFEGVVGYGVTGDLAIDDISVRHEPCPGFSKRAEVDFEMPGDLNGFKQFSQNETFWKWYDSRMLKTFPEKGNVKYSWAIIHVHQRIANSPCLF